METCAGHGEDGGRGEHEGEGKVEGEDAGARRMRTKRGGRGCEGGGRAQGDAILDSAREKDQPHTWESIRKRVTQKPNMKRRHNTTTRSRTSQPLRQAARR